MKFKENSDIVETANVYYDLFQGGYIKPENILEDPADVKRVQEAINILEEFLSQAEEEGIIISL